MTAWGAEIDGIALDRDRGGGGGSGWLGSRDGVRVGVAVCEVAGDRKCGEGAKMSEADTEWRGAMWPLAAAKCNGVLFISAE